MTTKQAQEIINKLNALWIAEVGSSASGSSSGDTAQNTAYESWERIPGNSVEYTYYPSETPGTTPENPSGNKNVETIMFKTGSTVISTQTYTYDVEDDVLSITTT